MPSCVCTRANKHWICISHAGTGFTPKGSYLHILCPYAGHCQVVLCYMAVRKHLRFCFHHHSSSLPSPILPPMAAAHPEAGLAAFPQLPQGVPKVGLAVQIAVLLTLLAVAATLSAPLVPAMRAKLDFLFQSSMTPTLRPMLPATSHFISPSKLSHFIEKGTNRCQNLWAFYRPTFDPPIEMVSFSSPSARLPTSCSLQLYFARRQSRSPCYLANQN